MEKYDSRVSPVGRLYGVGIIALDAQPTKFYETREKAIKAALACGCDFIVEFVGTSKKILAWNANIGRRDELIKKYAGIGDKLAKLYGCEEPCWLELSTSSGYNHIIPLSLVEAYEKIDLNNFDLSKA